MRTIPSHLRTKEISSFIDEMISYEDAKDFDSLDEIHQDKFVALCIRAFGCDVDIVLGSEGNSLLVKYLLSYDHDEEIEIMKALKESAREQFSWYFDEMLDEEKHDRYCDSMYEAGRRQIIDSTNGEARWI